MTEAGHGSDVQQLQTTATYDPETEEFVIRHPDRRRPQGVHRQRGLPRAHGGRVRAAVVAGEHHGVHALVVPLRDEHGTCSRASGSRTAGRRWGSTGSTTAGIWFDAVRVPREALLNRYGDVDADGVYTSPIENPGRRFFTMLGTLVQGRVCIAAAAVSAAKSALTIAVRYGLRRRQFGPRPGDEVPLLDYRTHQRRLMPLLARTYALHFAQAALTRSLRPRCSATPDTPDDASGASSSRWPPGMKATASWHATETIQTCRECCGGAGYMSVNRFAALKADTDVFTTFEGDNTVLMHARAPRAC